MEEHVKKLKKEEEMKKAWRLSKKERKQKEKEDQAKDKEKDAVLENTGFLLEFDYLQSSIFDEVD